MRLAWCVLVLAACDSHVNPLDVTGPYTGEVHRYYLDDVTLPHTSDMSRTLGDDLDGDKTVDNQLGATITALSAQGNDLTPHARDILAASPTHATLEIQADDLMTDKTVGVTLRGTDDDPIAVEVGGQLVGGVFGSNRTALAEDLGATTLHLPILVDADPSVFALRYMEIDLTPDTHGGYDARIRGLVPTDVLDVAAKGILQMIENNPADHAELVRILEPTAGAGPLTLAQVEGSGFLSALLDNDLTRDGEPYISFGFAAHFAPMPATSVSDTCHDRIRDGSESDVDCGPGCLPCAGGATCGSAGDCQAHSCSGTCGPVSCNDGVRDGIESDTDCGGWQCGACASGRACETDGDCVGGHCLASQTCE